MDELYETIKQKIGLSKNEKNFAVFDFDNTCIINDIAEATLAYMARNNLFKCKSILPGIENAQPQEISELIFKHYYQLIEKGNIREAYIFGAKTLQGLTSSAVIDLVYKVLDFEQTAITEDNVFGTTIAKGIQLRPPVISLMQFLKDNDVSIWIVSASPQVLVTAALKYFGIDARCVGIRNTITNGIIGSELEYPLSVVEGKVDCIKSLIHPTLQPILGIGDSSNDLPMLEYSDIKVVVNRHNSLSQKAAEEGWFILNT